MIEGRKILYRAVQWVTSVFCRWFEPEAAPMYPVPVLYDAIEPEQFLVPLLASNKSKID